jgi:hypothetical protein
MPRGTALDRPPARIGARFSASMEAEIATRTAPTLADMVARVERLERTVAALVARVERLIAAAALDDAAWLAVIALHVGGHVFTARALLRHSKLHPALADALGPVSPHALGLRFRRLAGRPCGGYLLQCVKRTGGRRYWSVVPITTDRHHGDSLVDRQPV